jgi:hypothetical protein
MFEQRIYRINGVAPGLNGTWENTSFTSSNDANLLALENHIHGIDYITGLGAAIDSKSIMDHTHEQYLYSISINDAQELYGQVDISTVGNITSSSPSTGEINLSMSNTALGASSGVKNQNTSHSSTTLKVVFENTANNLISHDELQFEIIPQN